MSSKGKIEMIGAVADRAESEAKKALSYAEAAKAKAKQQQPQKNKNPPRKQQASGGKELQSAVKAAANPGQGPAKQTQTPKVTSGPNVNRGAEALAAAMCFPGTKGIIAGDIAQTEPGEAVPVAYNFNLPQIADTDSIFVSGPQAGSSFFIVRPDPLNFFIYPSPTQNSFDLIAYSQSESQGDDASSAFTVYAGADTRVCVVGGDYHQTVGKSTRFYAMLSPKGERLVWLDYGELQVAATASLPSGYTYSIGCTLSKWNGSEVTPVGSFYSLPTAPTLGKKVQVKKREWKSHTAPVMANQAPPTVYSRSDKVPKAVTSMDQLVSRMTPLQRTQLAADVQASVKTGMPEIDVMQSVSIPIFAAGYYSLNFGVFVQLNSTNNANVVDISDSPIAFTFTCTHGADATANQSYLIHQPMVDIDKMFQLWETVSVNAAGFVATNISPVLQRGGNIAAAQIPRGQDWQNFMFAGSVNPYWFGGNRFNPYDLIQAKNPLLRYAGDAKLGASGHIRPDRDSLRTWKAWGAGETNFGLHLDQTVLATFSPLLPNGPSLICGFASPTGEAGATSQSFTVALGASVFYTTSSPMVAVTTDFPSEGDIMRALKAVHEAPQFYDNPDHVTNIADSLIGFFRNGRRVSKEAKLAVKEIAPSLYDLLARML